MKSIPKGIESHSLIGCFQHLECSAQTSQDVQTTGAQIDLVFNISINFLLRKTHDNIRRIMAYSSSSRGFVNLKCPFIFQSFGQWAMKQQQNLLPFVIFWCVYTHVFLDGFFHCWQPIWGYKWHHLSAILFYYLVKSPPYPGVFDDSACARNRCVPSCCVAATFFLAGP